MNYPWMILFAIIVIVDSSCCKKRMIIFHHIRWWIFTTTFYMFFTCASIMIVRILWGYIWIWWFVLCIVFDFFFIHVFVIFYFFSFATMKIKWECFWWIRFPFCCNNIMFCIFFSTIVITSIILFRTCVFFFSTNIMIDKIMSSNTWNISMSMTFFMIIRKLMIEFEIQTFHNNLCTYIYIYRVSFSCTF